jgi:hypothetical protein
MVRWHGLLQNWVRRNQEAAGFSKGRRDRHECGETRRGRRRFTPDIAAASARQNSAGIETRWGSFYLAHGNVRRCTFGGSESKIIGPITNGAVRLQKARPYIEAAAREGKDRVVLIGITQEKPSVWRSWVKKGHENRAHPHMEWGGQMAFINHFYFYIWDSDWGVLENQCVCSLSGLALAEWSRMGEAAAGESRDRI